MSKQFIEGNVYVFTKKKYLEDRKKGGRKSDIKLSLKWVDSVNGNKVTVANKCSGSVGKLKMFVFPEWCKCIKNNNQIEKDKKLNLCDTCKFEIPSCKATEEGVDFKFGYGIGNDNVYECKIYELESEEI